MNQILAISPKKRKIAQVLDSARDLFLQHGYEGVRMDEIARRASVSKATLYNYFPDKRMLFLEMARTECGRQAMTLEEAVDIERPVPEVLGVIGRGFLDIILSDFGRNMFRVCVSECERFPELGQQFYESGPAIMQARMSEFLELGKMRGELEIVDVKLAADQFPELCKAGVFMQLVFGVGPEITQELIDHTVDEAVATFMARYGARGHSL